MFYFIFCIWICHWLAFNQNDSNLRDNVVFEVIKLIIRKMVVIDFEFVP